MSTETRLYVESLEGHLVELGQAEAHHATHVLRLRAGAAVELFDGRGGRAQGRIAHVRRSEATVEIVERLPVAQPLLPRLHLGFAVPKGKRLDWLLEKATELAAASLRPVVFERSVAGEDELSDHKRQRWLGHCVSAAKQCGLDMLPDLLPPASVHDFACAASSAGWLCLVGDLSGPCLTPAQALTRRQERDVALLVGPEGGLADAERHLLGEADFLSVRTGSTTLRIETAAVALLAACRALCE